MAKVQNNITLVLTGKEVELVAALVNNVQLGSGCQYRGAALNIIMALENVGHWVEPENVKIGFQVETSSGIQITSDLGAILVEKA